MSEPIHSDSASAVPHEPIIPPGTHHLLLWLVATSFFMEMLDATILNNALPYLADYFHRDPLQMQLVIVAYLLTVALFIPVSGWFADRFGARRIFFSAIILFTFGSLLCALSSSFEMLVACRVVQGLGGSMMVPVGRLIILRATPRERLVSSLNFITVPALVGPLVGPTLGGILLRYATWHWIFLINIPIGILGAILTLRYLPRIQGRRRAFDWLGFHLFGSAMVLITIALDGAGALHMTRYHIMICLAIGTINLILCWFTIRWVREPLFHPGLFRIRSFSIGIVGGLIARLANGALPFLIPLFLQVPLGFSPLKTGLLLIPLSLSAIVAKAFVEPVLRLLGYRRFLLLNTVLLGALIASLALITPKTPIWLLIVHLWILGTINSLQFVAMNTLTLYDLPRSLESQGNSLLSVVMQISTSMGIAIATLLLLNLGGGRELHTGSLLRFHETFIATGMIAIAAAAIFLTVKNPAAHVNSAPQKPSDFE